MIGSRSLYDLSVHDQRDVYKRQVYEEGIRAIHDTSRGLALFVDSYRKLAELQEPVTAYFSERKLDFKSRNF